MTLILKSFSLHDSWRYLLSTVISRFTDFFQVVREQKWIQVDRVFYVLSLSHHPLPSTAMVTTFVSLNIILPVLHGKSTVGSLSQILMENVCSLYQCLLVLEMTIDDNFTLYVQIYRWFIYVYTYICFIYFIPSYMRIAYRHAYVHHSLLNLFWSQQV